jgi:hypothetical protein
VKDAHSVVRARVCHSRTPCIVAHASTRMRTHACVWMPVRAACVRMHVCARACFCRVPCVRACVRPRVCARLQELVRLHIFMRKFLCEGVGLQQDPMDAFMIQANPRPCPMAWAGRACSISPSLCGVEINESRLHDLSYSLSTVSSPAWAAPPSSSRN